MRLHEYFRSSAAFRVRIALGLKELSADRVFVHLRRGEQRAAEYLAVNPFGLVPALEVSPGMVVTQSLAILELLEEIHPEPPLLPTDAPGRARVRSLALAVAADTHPLTNLRVLEKLRSQFGADDEAVAAWYRHWVDETFSAMNTRLTEDRQTGLFSHGDRPTLADICLVPQVFGARRFGTDLDRYPMIQRITANCLALPAFDAARPERQPDAE